MDKLTGIHAVKEALEARPPIDRHRHREGEAGHASRGDGQQAAQAGRPVRFETRGRSTDWPIRKITRALCAGGARAAASLEDILAHANAGHGQPGLIVLLDEWKIRTLGQSFERRWCGAARRGDSRTASGRVTDTVARAPRSAGAFAGREVTKSCAAMEELKEAGMVWAWMSSGPRITRK